MAERNVIVIKSTRLCILLIFGGIDLFKISYDRKKNVINISYNARTNGTGRHRKYRLRKFDKS